MSRNDAELADSAARKKGCQTLKQLTADSASGLRTVNGKA